MITLAEPGRSVSTYTIGSWRRGWADSAKTRNLAEAVRFELTEDSHPRRFSILVFAEFTLLFAVLYSRTIPFR